MGANAKRALLSSFFQYNITLLCLKVHIVTMKALKKYKSVDEGKFDDLLEKYFSNDSRFALGIGQSKAALSMQRKRGLSIPFANAFTFYARYFMSDEDFDFVIEQMKQDGFKVEFDE